MAFENLKAFGKGFAQGVKDSVANGGRTSFNEQTQKLKEDSKKLKMLATQAQATGDPQKIQQANDAAANAADQVKQAETAPADQPPAENKPAENKPAETAPQQKQSGDNMVRRQIRAGRLSDSFYRDLTAGLRGKPTGNTLDAAATTAAEQSANQQMESGNRNMEGQAHQQIADQNVYSEADKEAMSKQDSMNRQNVRKAGVLGAGAALARSSATPDVQGAKARSDQQRTQAETQREKGDIAQQSATESAGQSMQFQLQSRDYDTDIDKTGRLSEGEGAAAEPEQQPPQPEQEQSEEPPADPPEKYQTSWQDALNYLTYGNDPTSGWNPNSSAEPKPGRDAAMKFAAAKGWTPIQATQAEYDGNVQHLQDMVKQQQGDFYDAWSKDSGRMKDGKQINKGDEGFDEASQTQTDEVESDERVKNVKRCLCDARMKWIREDFDRDGKCSREDFDWLLSQLGNNFDYNGHSYNNQNDEGWDDSVLKAYADHIRNYVYTYKPEATKIDSRIDPNEEHIGPMAQDIEQVNPACVKETPEGVKTVDTSRLAMMNAGAIADLARQFQELTEKLKALGVQ